MLRRRPRPALCLPSVGGGGEGRDGKGGVARERWRGRGATQRLAWEGTGEPTLIAQSTAPALVTRIAKASLLPELVRDVEPKELVVVNSPMV